MTREEAFKEINETQDYYVNLLVERIENPANNLLKEDNFTSDTGTGKTRMIAKLATKLPNYFFLVTTLSKGQLDTQTANVLSHLENIAVYGIQKLTAASKLTTEALYKILRERSLERPVIWLRDEGHQHTNKWADALEDKCFKIINISATNKVEGLRTNFMHTMMLRTVIQTEGTPEDAIKKLLVVKEQHKHVKNYNPCAIVRSLTANLTDMTIALCEKYNLKYINLTNNDNYDMTDLCRDDNDIDVIINKFKVVEGVDLRRAHVLYMTNVPSNFATAIQVIGRCRRNALLYPEPASIGTDIFSEKNTGLLDNTMKCYVFNNKIGGTVPTDRDGNLVVAFCDRISVEQLKPGITFQLRKGKLLNGLYIAEATTKDSGNFMAVKDTVTGYNQLVKCNSRKKLIFYSTESTTYDETNIVVPVTCFKENISSSGAHYLYSDGGSLNRALCIKDDLLHAKVVSRNVHYIWSDSWYTKRCKEVIDVTGRKVFVPVTDENLTVISYNSYTKIENDEEQAIIAVDTFKYLKSKDTWIEERAITSKVNKHTKFQGYIAKTYNSLLVAGAKQCFGKEPENDCLRKFTDNQLNKCLGWCVEYYSKYLVYGELYLQPFLSKAFSEAHTNIICPGIIVRACILKYKEQMKRAFGDKLEEVIPSIGIDKLLSDNCKQFITAVTELGKKTADFVEAKIGKQTLVYGAKLSDPNLSTRHLSGLADYITEDTIIDVKVTNCISINYLRQVLAYHYLSTKRSDLHIKRVVVFDAVSGRHVELDVSNITFEAN